MFDRSKVLNYITKYNVQDYKMCDEWWYNNFKFTVIWKKEEVSEYRSAVGT